MGASKTSQNLSDHIEFAERIAAQLGGFVNGPGYRVDPDTGCWNWIAKRDRKGYGYLFDRRNQTTKRAHRWTYERLKAPIPYHMLMDHLCRNPSCVNPDHLEPVTNATNVQRGCRAKVTPEEVREMRRAYEAREVTQQSLADRYGVHVETMRKILHRRTWANV